MYIQSDLLELQTKTRNQNVFGVKSEKLCDLYTERMFCKKRM